MSILKLPGLVDVHVHLRDDQSQQWAYKEDFLTGTSAAVAGGYTALFDMPNNPDKVISPEALNRKIQHAEGRIFCDVGFHFGASDQHHSEYASVADRVGALKIYMDHTTGDLLVESQETREKVFQAWPAHKRIFVHAELGALEVAIELAKKYGRKLHVCHVSLAAEIELIKKMKEEGMDITCEVTAHHLLLNDSDAQRLGPYGNMKPPLQSQRDVDALWKNLPIINCIASDHAPHTKEEKESQTPYYGVPGLETYLPLLLQAVHDKRLSLETLIEKLSENPRKIIGLPTIDEDMMENGTYIEVEMDEKRKINDEYLFTKCGWTPFMGMDSRGRVERVVLRGEDVFAKGKIIGKPRGSVIQEFKNVL